MNIKDFFEGLTINNLKKYAFGFKIVTILFFAYLVAIIINSEIISPLLKIEDDEKISSFQRTSKIKTTNPREYYEIILDRNIFDSTDKPVPGGMTAGMGTDSDDFDLTGPSVPTTLPITLLGTMVLNNPSYSIAIINNGGNKDSNVYRIKDILRSSAVIILILRNKVIFKNNGRLEHIEVLDKEMSFTSEKSPSDIGIKEQGDGKYNISRRELDQAFSDLSTILTQARVVPHFEDGKTVGFRIFSIVPDSIYTKLGLKNHDIISRINGMVIDDPTKGLQFFNTLKNESNIKLDIVRNGVNETLTYDIIK